MPAIHVAGGGSLRLRRTECGGQDSEGGAPARALEAKGPTCSSEAGCQGGGRLRKKGLRDAVAVAAAAHPDKRIALWFQDEARVGQKGRTGHRWWVRGERPTGLCDRRVQSAYIFAAVRPPPSCPPRCARRSLRLAPPATGEEFCLVLPRVSTAAMHRFLADFAATVPSDTHAVMVLDGAGWHGARALPIPRNVTLVPLPAYSPDLNPVERVWLYLRERYLSHRLLDDYHAVVDACCRAWNALTSEPGRLQSLCDYPYLRQVSS